MERKENEYRKGARSAGGMRPVPGGALRSVAAGLFCCLLAIACSKEPVGDTDGDRVEIIPEANMPWDVSASSQALESANQGAATPGGAHSAITRAEAGPDDALDLYFVRSDETSADVWGPWAGTALKATRAAGAGNLTLAFEQKQYYPANGLKTKMLGWYPGGGTAAGQGDGYYNAGAVQWTFDGSQDIMTAAPEQGSGKSAMPVFEFGHALSQVQFYIYADADAAEQWGAIESIEITEQKNVATLTLPVSSADAAVIAFSGGATTFAAQGLTPGQAPEVAKADAAAAGMAMIEPHGTDYTLNLSVKTANRGTETFSVPARTYEAGKAVKVYLRFTKLSVEVESAITFSDWVDGGPEAQAAYPYVVDGKIIVSKSVFGQADYPVRDEVWTSTPAHAEGGVPYSGNDINNDTGLNTAAARFEVVASTDKCSWSDARERCLEYDVPAGTAGKWRMPTWRELKVIYDMKDKLTAVSFGPAYHWSATERFGYEEAWCVINDGDLIFTIDNPKTDIHGHWCCVRDL